MTTAKKSTTKKSASAPKHKSTAAKGGVKVKMIQSVDTSPGKDTTVFFTDGTHAKVKAGNKLALMLQEPTNVAPNLIQVTVNRGIITEAERVDVPGAD